MLDHVVAHARNARPAECCGILLGKDDQILEAVAARNLSNHATRFFIDPKDHIDARREARRRGLQVVGFYHSHPGSEARPSASDRAEAAYPGHMYLIVSLQHEPPEIRVFRFTDGNFHETPFVTLT